MESDIFRLLKKEGVIYSPKRSQYRFTDKGIGTKTYTAKEMRKVLGLTKRKVK